MNLDYPEDLLTLNDLLKWTKPNDEEIKDFLVKEKQFSEEKVDNGLKKLNKFGPTQGKTQARLDGFFKPNPNIANLNK